MSLPPRPPSVSIVVPCYRSPQTLEPLVRRLRSTLDSKALTYEIVLVVDGSPDETWAVVEELAADEHIRGIELMRNYGQHNAVLAGILKAEHEVIVTMDDDLQHAPEDVPRLLEALDDEVDLVYGVGEVETHSLFRNLASRSVKSAMAVILGVDHARSISSFRALRSDLKSAFADLSDAFVSIDVLLSWVTTRIKTIEVQMDQRKEGNSGYRTRTLVNHALNMVTGYSTKPLQLVALLGFATALLGLGLLIAVLTLFFTGRTEVAGFTTIASMIALFSGAQMAAIGILGEYLGRLHFRSMHRPTFVIRNEVGPSASLKKPRHTSRGRSRTQPPE